MDALFFFLIMHTHSSIKEVIAHHSYWLMSQCLTPTVQQWEEISNERDTTRNHAGFR